MNSRPQIDAWAARRALLNRHFLLNNLGENAIGRILQFSTIRKIAEGQILFTKGDPGDGLYGILSGKIRIFTVAANGDEYVLRILGDGALFGEIALLDGNPRTASAGALEPCEILFVPRSTFLSFLHQHPSLMARMIELLCDELRKRTSEFETVVFLELAARLSKHLLQLAANYGENTPEGVRLNIRLPQRLLAEMTGATREAVNKTLMNFKNANTIAIQNGYLILKKPEALRSIAEGAVE